MSEQRPIRDIAHEQFHDDEEFVDGLIEPRCRSRLRGASNGLLEIAMGVGVIELNDFDAAEVVVVAGKLAIAGTAWERRF